MPDRVPSYRLHRQSGQAVVTLPDGLGVRRDFLLGVHGSAASRRKYEQLVAEWLAGGRRLSPPTPTTGPGITINELVHRFRDHAERYYRRPDGSATSEVTEFKYSVRPLRELYGMTPAAEFTPLALKTVRERFIALGWSRGLVNRRVGRIRHVFKWGVSEGLVPEIVHGALKTVTGLPYGRSAARETAPVEAVSQAVVDAIPVCCKGPATSVILP